MTGILMEGWNAVVDYVTLRRVVSLGIAFFLSGAITRFMSRGAVLRYFGPRAPRALSYLVASVSGAILTVCSCSVLPMFASIRHKGAGIGPAVTFLFSGPAINILAILFTFNLIGTDIGLVRVVGAVLVALLIGLIMYAVFHRSEEREAGEEAFEREEVRPRKPWQNLLFFATLTGILLTGVRQPLPTMGLTALLGVQLAVLFQPGELREWCRTTFDLAKKIVPLFLGGVFLAGILEAVIPPEHMVRFVGGNSYGANAIAGTFGAFVYFATLTEVPIVNSFLELGMGRGPATALLLAGPSLSLPNMIVISRVLGGTRTATYIALVIALSALVGMLAGYLVYGP